MQSSFGGSQVTVTNYTHKSEVETTPAVDREAAATPIGIKKSRSMVHTVMGPRT